MKNIILSLFAIALMSSSIFGQEDQSKTHKRIIVKKIERQGDEKLTDAEIQKLIDSIMVAEGVNDSGKQEIWRDKRGKEHKIEFDKKMEFITDDEHTNSKKECGSSSIPQNKAVLGIQLEDAPGDNGANILGLYDGSGAEKAGLLAGDLILGINGKKVKNMLDVIEALSKNSPGDQVKVKYMRNGDVNSSKVKLQEAAATLSSKCCKGQSNCCKPRQGTCGTSEKKIEKTIIINSDQDGGETKEIIDGDKRIIIKSQGDNKNIEVINKSNETKTIKMQTNDENESLMIEYNGSYPNPNQGLLKVNFTGAKTPTTVQVLDLNGKEVYSEKIDNFDGTYNKEINLNDAKGTLILNIRQGEKIISEKIIVK